jgi:hypothetical protein
MLDEFIIISPSIDGKRSEQFVDAHKSQVANQNLQNPNNQLKTQPEQMKN